MGSLTIAVNRQIKTKHGKDQEGKFPGIGQTKMQFILSDLME